jgi:hypothetical protein
VALRPGDDRDLVAFDPAFKLGLRLEVNDPAASLGGHLMEVVLVEAEFLRDLLVRQVEAHEIEAKDPLA